MWHLRVHLFIYPVGHLILRVKKRPGGYGTETETKTMGSLVEQGIFVVKLLKSRWVSSWKRHVCQVGLCQWKSRCNQLVNNPGGWPSQEWPAQHPKFIFSFGIAHTKSKLTLKIWPTATSDLLMTQEKSHHSTMPLSKFNSCLYDLKRYCKKYDFISRQTGCYYYNDPLKELDT